MTSASPDPFEMIEFPFPLGLLSGAVASTTTAPPDAGSWSPDDWAAWATWRAIPGEMIGVFRDRIIAELKAADGTPAHIFIYGCTTCWQRDAEGLVSLKPAFAPIAS